MACCDQVCVPVSLLACLPVIVCMCMCACLCSVCAPCSRGRSLTRTMQQWQQTPAAAGQLAAVKASSRKQSWTMVGGDCSGGTGTQLHTHIYMDCVLGMCKSLPCSTLFMSVGAPDRPDECAALQLFHVPSPQCTWHAEHIEPPDCGRPHLICSCLPLCLAPVLATLSVCSSDTVPC